MIFYITIEDTTKGPHIYLHKDTNDVLDNPEMSLATHMAASLMTMAGTIYKTLHITGIHEVKH